MAEANPRNGFFSMGQKTLAVPMELFAENRRRLVASLNKNKKVSKGSVVLLQGGGDQGVCEGDSSDVGPVFRQESYFHWAFGVLEPDFFGAIDLSTGRSILYQPRLPEDYAIIMGHIPTAAEIQERYRVDEVRFTDEIPDHLRSLQGSTVPTLLLLEGPNTDSGKTTRPAAFDGISEFPTDNSILHHEMAELRVIKTKMELEGMRYASKISSEAHMHVMRTIKPGMMEYQAEATFLHHTYFYGGARHVCYTCIAGGGGSGAVLHYGHAGAPNNQLIKDGDMVLFDFGAEYYCFCSDITCSWPANGKKSSVPLDVLATLKPGVSWRDLHLLANRVILEDLTAAGVLTGSVDAMMSVNLAGRLFQPHGLGHFIGIDVHDVGGYLEGHPERDTRPGLRSLRTAREIQANMVLTIEPGCYFIDFLIDRALADPELSRFLVADLLNEYRGSGGVRIEDDVIVHENGAELMSVVPRTVEEIESWMSGDDAFLKNIK
ncbi:xaa-Pro dipeptidase [Eurytemora carolleeae]|uniref:xaa-Pro dipeptidase n=1 Tax=Eurytemora carolleeae TaxID=1294199 RepID=UPI000C765B2C|nr:xaa-Pro dipeptidase [Eurytemora carolleeae]|eukprot:XP_023340154.1 xaa-Pro dipeptidase-like [Eurytemora affinis]